LCSLSCCVSLCQINEIFKKTNKQTKGEGKKSQGTKTNNKSELTVINMKGSRAPRWQKESSSLTPFIHGHCPFFIVVHLGCCLFSAKFHNRTWVLWSKGICPPVQDLPLSTLTGSTFYSIRAFPNIILAFGLFGILRIKNQSEPFKC